jgi:hypothetical protein
MTDSKKRISEKEALTIVAELGEIVRSTRSERLADAFGALAALDAYRIERRAQEVIDRLDPDILDDGGMGPEGLLHQARMETFRTTLFECLEEG